jgi:hypothetical protein
MMEPGAVVVRDFREGDERAILRIVSEKPGAELSLEEWSWLFPAEEDGRLIVVGEKNGEVVGVGAGTPIRITVNGREWSAIELRHLVSSDPADSPRLTQSLVESFTSDNRFALVFTRPGEGALVDAGFVVAKRSRATVLERVRPRASLLGRVFYQAEPARDWEPRLDQLWRRARKSYPVAVVRDADRALRRFAAHPTIRHHRFVVRPRYSREVAAFAVFVVDGDRCRWADLLWDHDHPGALDLLAHISGRLVVQLGADREVVWLSGDDDACSKLARCGFAVSESSTEAVIAARSIEPELDAEAFVERAYLTVADLGGVLP